MEALARAAGFCWSNGEKLTARFAGVREMALPGQDETARILRFETADGGITERWSNFQWDALLDSATVKNPVKVGDVLCIKAGKVKGLRATDTRPEGHKFRTFDISRYAANEVPAEFKSKK